jgi:hypothetical protein
MGYFLLGKAAESISPNVQFPRDIHDVMLKHMGHNFTFTLTNLQTWAFLQTMLALRENFSTYLPQPHLLLME